MGRKCKDYTNQLCGCWLVKERDRNPHSKSHETFWICECQNCGTISSVRKTDLDRKPQFCNNCKGAQLRSWKVGDRFGKLTIINKGSVINHHSYVTVQCDCGSDPFQVRLDHLKGQNRNSPTISCGCSRESAGELKIRQLLAQTNLDFQTQYRIKDENNDILIFDFVIFQNNRIVKCIEFNGQQHYEPIEIFGGEEAFKHQQERDARKTVYCAAHQIILQWIPYTEYDNITLELLLSSLEIKN